MLYHEGALVKLHTLVFGIGSYLLKQGVVIILGSVFEGNKPVDILI